MTHGQGGQQPGFVTFTNSIGMEFALLPPGCFLMGSPEGEPKRYPDERLHAVELSQAFWMGVYPVTQEQYQMITGSTSSFFRSTGRGSPAVTGLDPRRFPVESVSWEDAAAFCERLNEREGKRGGAGYRLPTEAMWEYACRAGAPESYPFHVGTPLSTLTPSQANISGIIPYTGEESEPSLKRTCPVGSFAANAFSLHDMHGMVWEWCHDWYAKGRRRKEVQRDPAGPERGSARVVRGGSWIHSAGQCRSANRNSYGRTLRNHDLGFRVALVSAEDQGRSGAASGTP
jgi:sulfatase modifying factor 1